MEVHSGRCEVASIERLPNTLERRPLDANGPLRDPIQTNPEAMCSERQRVLRAVRRAVPERENEVRRKAIYRSADLH